MFLKKMVFLLCVLPTKKVYVALFSKNALRSHSLRKVAQVRGSATATKNTEKVQEPSVKTMAIPLKHKIFAIGSPNFISRRWNAQKIILVIKPPHPSTKRRDHSHKNN